MSDDASGRVDRAAVNRLLNRLNGFAYGLGLDETTARQIAEEVAAAIPFGADEERVVEARKRMLAATA